MNEDMSKIIGYLSYLGIKGLNPELIYNDRFFLQKFVYILKALGLSFSYDFNLYLKGPYSTRLTIDYFQYSNQISTVTSLSDHVEIPSEDLYQMAQVEQAILDRFKEVVISNSRYQEKKYELLECIATILFLIKEQRINDDMKINEELKINKPFLGSSIVTLGFNIVKELFFQPQFLTKEIKQEIDLWDKAED